MNYKKCPIFEATGIAVHKKVDECHACPFRNSCPQDIMDKAVSDILRNIGRYLHGEGEKPAGM